MGIPTFHVVNALPPVADVEEGGFVTDVVNAQGSWVWFYYQTGVNAGGDCVITALACDNVTPSNTTAIPFQYRTSVATDIWSEWTAATAAAGFTTSTVSNAHHQVLIDPAELAEEGFGYVRIIGTEDTDNTVLGGVTCIVFDARYAPSITTLLT